MPSSKANDAETIATLMNGLESMEEAFVMYDKDGFLVACNRAFKKLYNYTDAQARPGVHFRDLGVIDIENGNVAIGTTDGEDYLAKKAEYRKTLKGSFDVWLKDGRWIRTTDRATPGGGFVSVQTDITEQKRAEKRIQDSELRLSALVRTSPVVIYSVDVRDKFKPTFTSENVKQLFGYSVQECLEMPDFWENRLHPDEAPSVVRNMNQKIATTNAFSHEYRIRLPNGSYRWVLDEVNVIRDEDGTPIQLVGTWLDISNRKAMEDDLRHATEEAQAANKAKSAFLANMSHEIRTPMNGVLGMAELLGKTELNGDQSRMVSAIVNSGNSLMRIIDDVLDYSKIEAGKLDLDIEDMDLRETLEGIAIMMAPSADENNVRLHLRINPEVPSRIRFDVVRLRQILTNLLSNAIKFSRKSETDAKGQIQFVTEVINGNQLRVQVMDNGVGMSETALASLFTPFEQAEASTTRRFGGTGLGLSIVKNLVDLMHGSIEVTSEFGQGATFTVTLPFEPLANQHPDVRKTHIPGVGLFDDEVNVAVIKANRRQPKSSELQIAENEEDLINKLDAIDGPAFANLALGSMAENTVVMERIRARRPGTFFMCQTSDRSDKLGLVAPDCYVLSRFPTLPSEITRALEAFANGTSGNDLSEQKTDAAQAASPRETRLLLVEDNDTNQLVITAQLNVLGYTSDVAGNGLEGLEKWKTGAYDLILADCHMPEMDGFELTQAIRKAETESGQKRTPIIAITANALKGESEKCIAAGMDAYLSKPVSLDLLKKTLSHWLSSGSAPE